ncbi:MAG: tetratricopeptide repeat protein [Candidatus Omnitrophota bacterium]|nr:tetratricopeptide repeat protein [Candidatus Omnitrophota bacterium]
MRGIRLISVISLLVVSFLTVCVCFADTKQNYYYKGLEFAVAGEFEKAKKEFEKILRIDVFYTPAHSSWQVVVDALDARVAKTTALNIFKGIDYANSDLLERAVNEFNMIIEQNPYYVNTYFFRGSVYYKKGLYQEAISDYTKVVDKGGALISDAYYNRGSIHSIMGDSDEAISDYSKVIERYPKHPDIYYSRGVTYASIEKYELAIADYDKVIELDTKNSRVYLDKAAAAFKLGRFIDAIKAFKIFLKYKSNDFFEDMKSRMAL